MKIKILDKNDQLLYVGEIGRGTVQFTLYDKQVYVVYVRGRDIFFEAMNTDEGTISRQYRFHRVGNVSWRYRPGYGF